MNGGGNGDDFCVPIHTIEAAAQPPVFQHNIMYLRDVDFNFLFD